MPEVLTIDRLSRYASAEAVAVAAGSPKLTKGAQRLWEVLHGAAVQVAAYRGYSAAVSQVVVAVPQNGVAALMGWTVRHTHRVRAELEAAGLVAAQGWVADVHGRHMHALTLWAVKSSTTSTTPRLTAEDFRAKWRDFAADLNSKNTVRHAMSSLLTLEEDSQVIDRLATWHVTGRFSDCLNPLQLGVTLQLGSLKSAIESLGMLANAPAGVERRKVIQQLAGWLADSLHDQHSFRWWCRQLWQVAGEWEKVGALQAQLSRLLADLDEYGEILNPAAWFSARQRPAMSAR